MKVILEIPEEFEKHFNIDRFEGILLTLIEYANLHAGNYEKEFADMLIDAFRNAEMLGVEECTKQ